MAFDVGEKHTYDCVVVGSGPGGLIGAVTAGKLGLKTALIEKNAFVGGCMQIGLNIHGFEDMNGSRIIGGSSWELIQRCIRQGGSVGPVKLENSHMYSTTPVDLGILQSCALEMLEESNVDIWLNTLATEVTTERDRISEIARISEIVTWSKSGKNVFAARTFIDATGDADIAYRAGVPTVSGRESDGSMQPMSLVLTMAPVNIKELVDELGMGYGKAVKPGCKEEDYIWFALNFKNWRDDISRIGIELGREGVFWGNSIHPGIVNLNAVKVVGKSGSDTRELSSAEIQSRKAATRFGEFLHNNSPGFAEAYIVRIAPYIGVRETRRIEGRYELQKADVTEGTIPDDTVVLGGYPIDIHDPSDGIAEFMGLARGRFGIPYPALLPKGTANLLVSGRAISATHEAVGATRVMGTCLAIGEACGYAAVMAKRNDTDVSKLSGVELRKELEKEGMICG